MAKPLSSSFYRKPTLKLAKDLLGKWLVHESHEGTTAGRIVETEAYLHDDPACHAFSGPTPRTQVMFGPPGVSYVYFIYGMYWCFNVVSGPKNRGEAVLIRALEPIEGIDLMRQRRKRGHALKDRDLCNGPGKLCEAMGIVSKLNGANLTVSQLYIAEPPKRSSHEVHTTTRIGITKAAHHPYRFYLRGNPFVSRP